MATIPTAYNSGQRNAPSATRRGIVGFDSNAGAGAMAAGKAIQQFGAELSAEAKQRQQEQDKLQAAQASLMLKEYQLNKMDEFRQRPNDYAKYKEEYKTGFQQTYESVSALFTNPKMKQQFMLAANEMYLDGANKVGDLSFTQDKNHQVAWALEKSQAMQRLASTDPSQVPSIKMMMGEMWKGLASSGYIDAAEAVKYGIDTADAIDEASISMMSPAEKIKFVEGATSVSIQDYKADTVKPYDAKRVQSLRSMVAMPSEYDALFQEMGAKYGVDPQELKLRAAVESGLNPTAQAEATPYGQSGGLMQLEVNTAKSLGVTDRNDPRQSVEGAAKLLAGYQKKYGNDQAMIDKMYYAGSEKMVGKNTEQYAANLAALRGAGSASNVALKYYKELPKLAEDAFANEVATNPQNALASLESGNYDKYFSASVKKKNKDLAVSAIQKQQEDAANARFAKQTIANGSLYNSIINNSPDALQQIAKFRETAQSPEDVEFADNMTRAFYKTNPLSKEEIENIRTSNVTDFEALKQRAVDAGSDAGFNEGPDVGEILSLRRRLMQDSARGVPYLSGLIKELTVKALEYTGIEEGYDDAGWKLLGERSEAYDAGYQVIQDHVTGLQVADQQKLTTKMKMFDDFVAEADNLPPEIKANKAALDTALREISNNVIKTSAAKRTPSLMLVDGKPSGVVKSDGSVENLGTADNNVKADSQVSDVGVKNIIYPNGVKARATYKDGVAVKIEILNEDGTVKETRYK